VRFHTVAETRRFLWGRLAQILNNASWPDDACEDEFDRRRMRKAVEQIVRTLRKRSETKE
jgi:hypothetical protein